MRRLVPLLTAALPRHATACLSIAATVPSHATAPRQQRTTPALGHSAVAAASATTLSEPDALDFAAPSFEIESELEQAQRDLQELRAVTRPLPAPETQPVQHTAAVTHRRPGAIAEATTAPAADQPWHTFARPSATPAASPAAPEGLPAPPHARPHGHGFASVALPALLQQRRWSGVEHERYRNSRAGYADACADTLRTLVKQYADADADGAVTSDGAFEEHIHAQLRCAHADALLALLEECLAAITDSSERVHADAALVASVHGTLALHLLHLLAHRVAELSGKHMAHLSNLLLECSPLIHTSARGESARTAAVREGVWTAFTVLCYRTRRTLRRRQNIDCLEALLWGVYGGQSPRTDTRQARSLPTPALHCLCHAELLPKVRQAALSHLTHRCLLLGKLERHSSSGGASSSTSQVASRSNTASAAAASSAVREKADLVLAWAMLLGHADMDPAVHAAVTAQLRKPHTGATPANGRLSLLQPLPSGVLAWRRLARRVSAVTAAPLTHAHVHGTAAPTGAAAFQRLDDIARATDGWAVAAADRLHLRAMCAPPQRVKGATAMAPYGADAGGVARWRTAATAARMTGAIMADAETTRVKAAAAAAVRTHALLRWAPLPLDDAPGRSGGAAGVGSANAAAAAAVLADECDELVQSAMKLPTHAVCLAEAVAFRLLRCLRDWLALPNCVAPHASAPRQLTVALLALLRHTRAEATATALAALQCDSDAVDESARRRAASGIPVRLLWGAALRTPRDAVQVVQAWASRRELSARVPPVAAVRQLRQWLLDLPSPFHSPELVQAVSQWADAELCNLPQAQPSSPELQDYRDAWLAVVSVAQSHASAQRLLEAWETQPSTSSGRCPASGRELRRTCGQMRSVNAAVPLQRLRWVAELNGSAVQEWQWHERLGAPAWAVAVRSLRWSTLMLQRSATVSDAVLLVAASEATSSTEIEDTLLQLLCRRNARRLRSLHERSWQDAATCAALESMLKGTAAPPGCVEEALESGVSGGQAETKKAERTPFSASVFESSAVLHYLRVGDDTATATPPRPCSVRPSYSVAELDEALWTLAGFGRHLASRPQQGAADDTAATLRNRAATALAACATDARRALGAAESLAGVHGATAPFAAEAAALWSRLPVFEGLVAGYVTVHSEVDGGARRPPHQARPPHATYAARLAYHASRHEPLPKRTRQRAEVLRGQDGT